ncbi:MAG TPA: MFS transporter [Acidimicrobiales bacterium]|nr:MFS transporter [Acidimicrobiales bacterium]
MRRAAPATGRSNLAAAVAATVSCAAPVFLVGALAVQMRRSLHFGAGTLGTVVAMYYLGAGLSSALLGRMVEAVGGLRTMRIACLASGALLLLMATATRSVVTLGVLLAAAGVSSAALQPAANLFLLRRMPLERQGLAFGIKQSAVPLTTSLAGLAVPAFALTVGWRWAFVSAGTMAAAVGATLPLVAGRPTAEPHKPQRPHKPAAPPQPPRSGSGPLWVLAGGFGLGLGAASAMTAFLVSSSVATGMSHRSAGLLVAAGGAAAIAGRIVSGRIADRRGGDHLPAVAWMLGMGAAAYLVLALVTSQRLTALYLPVVLVVFGAGWGWNGLFNFAVVSDYPHQPAWATGVTQTGGRLGGVIGPFLFGQAVSHGSYTVAWAAAGVACVAAAAVLLAGRRALRRQHLPAPSGPLPDAV